MAGGSQGSWFIVFDFNRIGYVPDTEQKDLNTETTNALLDSFRKGAEVSNQERQRRGWPTISIVGWERPPFYDPFNA